MRTGIDPNRYVAAYKEAVEEEGGRFNNGVIGGWNPGYSVVSVSFVAAPNPTLGAGQVAQQAAQRGISVATLLILYCLVFVLSPLFWLMSAIHRP